MAIELKEALKWVAISLRKLQKENQRLTALAEKQKAEIVLLKEEIHELRRELVEQELAAYGAMGQSRYPKEWGKIR